MGRRVFFGVAAHGYEFAKDGFGIRGVVLEPKPGGAAKLKIKRLNIAERLYRITGHGHLPRHRPARPQAAGRRAAAQRRGDRAGRHPQRRLPRASSTGSTATPAGSPTPLGNFAMAGATTDLPEKLDPDVGIDLKYFAGQDGFARPHGPDGGRGRRLALRRWPSCPTSPAASG